jgi:hypothetical protein
VPAIPGAVCFSISSILPMTENSNVEKPVMSPPGRARLATRRCPAGSGLPASTIGMELVCWRRTDTARRPATRIASTLNSISSAACARRWSNVAVEALLNVEVYTVPLALAGTPVDPPVSARSRN